ncbi:MAG: hypothetical protein A2Y07_06470 [Planctomycetes bacterium GWF2_50_10]|nr:MAG: hypothetical protein A2Y07_06470 [Planctomycetes bacterium GWF2_50_10]
MAPNTMRAEEKKHFGGNQVYKTVPFKTSNGSDTKLASNGGEPVISSQMRAKVPQWPIANERTAEALKFLYMSGKWSFNGIYEQQFASGFAKHHSCEYGIMMANGTVTLECALKALGVGPGDEVIVPALTWVATAMAAVYVGATPVFVDIEPDTLCLDPVNLSKAITKRTAAIIPVHLYGSMADMEAIMDIANCHGIPVIEDCAHAHGGFWDGKGLGSIGTVGSSSFQQSKNMASGEGGICVTNNKDMAEKLFRLKHIGYDMDSSQGKAASGPPAELLCCNYRATEFQALILLNALSDLRAQTELRDSNAKYLGRLLEDVEGVQLQSKGRKATLQSYYNLVFLVDPARFNCESALNLMDTLRAEGLAVDQTYGPVYSHMLWNVSPSKYRIAGGECPVCEKVCAKNALTLFHPWLLTDHEIMNAIAQTFRKLVN